MKKIILVLLITGNCFHSVAWAAMGDIVIYRGAFNYIISNQVFEHAGIDTGDGYVIEFSGSNGVENSGTPVIVKILMSEFIKNSPTKQVEVLDFNKTFPKARGYISVYSSEFTVNCAKEYLKNGGRNFGVYNPRTNNCQHFAMFCKTGQKQSWQVNALTELVFEPLRKYNDSLAGLIDASFYLIDVASEYAFSGN